MSNAQSAVAAQCKPLARSNDPSTTGVETFWERAARTRWGQYVTSLEKQVLLSALDRFAAPGVGLDVGCEGGRWSQVLTDRGWSMIATDVDPDSLEICRRRNSTVRCLLVDSQDEVLPVDSRTIDLMLCFEVPVVEDPWFAAEAHRVLKPGGVLVGSMLNLCSWRGAAANAKSTLVGRERHYKTSYASFRRCVQQHGFSMDRVCGCCWAPFGRHSDSPWISVATKLEQMFGLRRIPTISPWVVYTATRH